MNAKVFMPNCKITKLANYSIPDYSLMQGKGPYDYRYSNSVHDRTRNCRSHKKTHVV
jgi:hypothetical protein